MASYETYFHALEMYVEYLKCNMRYHIYSDENQKFLLLNLKY